MMRRLMIITTVVSLTLALTTMGSVDAKGDRKKVTVGCKNFTEQYIIGHMIKQLLETRGFTVDLKADLTSMALRAGMESGDIDICAEYTGTAWMIHLKREYKPGTDNDMLYELVKKEDKGNNFIWLDPIWNNNTYALASWYEFATKHDLKTLSDLARLYREKKGRIDTFVDFEFSTRPDGLRSLEEFYDFKVAKAALKTGTPGASLISLKQHKTDVAMVFGTDASIAKYRWFVFVDNKSFFPPYDLTPYVATAVLDQYPKIADIINRLVATFPGSGNSTTPKRVAECQKVWQELNAKVDIEKKEPQEVAREYLIAHGLVKR
ncbi:MAG: glycine/betaine ABC transporter substrate-binding protein [Deltaproteobacteria bacterium]|nr:glycine/betaine ABC transporter substrate-binding protein [Deltaproteobacteria bacterium]